MEAYNLMLHLKDPNAAYRRGNRNQGINDGLTFLNHARGGNDVKDNGMQPWHSDATCYNCGEKGHIAKNCPKKKKNQDKTPEAHTTNTIQGNGEESQSSG